MLLRPEILMSYRGPDGAIKRVRVHTTGDAYTDGRGYGAVIKTDDVVGMSAQALHMMIAALVSDRKPTVVQDGDVMYIDLGEFVVPSLLSTDGVDSIAVR